mgnify:CR=1 FL=1
MENLITKYLENINPMVVFVAFVILIFNTLPLAVITYSPEIYPLSVLYQLSDVFAINCKPNN